MSQLWRKKLIDFKGKLTQVQNCTDSTGTGKIEGARTGINTHLQSGHVEKVQTDCDCYLRACINILVMELNVSISEDFFFPNDCVLLGNMQIGTTRF